MNSRFSLINSASELPADWDALTVSYFQKREFLIHTEKYNPCKQRYWILEESGELKAGAVLYTLRLDLLTFMHLKSPLEMHIAGIPCSGPARVLLETSFIFTYCRSILFPCRKASFCS